jgi:hypothetical protein
MEREDFARKAGHYSHRYLRFAPLPRLVPEVAAHFWFTDYAFPLSKRCRGAVLLSFAFFKREKSEKYKQNS